MRCENSKSCQSLLMWPLPGGRGHGSLPDEGGEPSGIRAAIEDVRERRSSKQDVREKSAILARVNQALNTDSSVGYYGGQGRSSRGR